MPFVNVRTARGLLTPEQKSELATRLTDLMVEVEGKGNPRFRDLVWILIEEHEAESWCLAGTQVNPQLVREIAGG